VPRLRKWESEAARNKHGSTAVYKIMHKTLVFLAVVIFSVASFAVAQQSKPTASGSIPVSTQNLLDGVKSTESKSTIKSVLMLECPKDGMKGTGFVLPAGGIVATNSHVVGNCSAQELVGKSSVSVEDVKFVSMERDPHRDLALLCTGKPLPFSLTLKGDANPPVDSEVETWGYPLFYEDAAPVLSRGYVAGYTMGRDSDGHLKNPPVRHLIVNGAINPGNSGGPLIDRVSGKVIGIVVEKWALFSPSVGAVITGLQHSKTMTGGGLQVTDANGVTMGVSNEVAMAIALKEIYDKSQVMIGEAISVSELNAFINENQQTLACGRH
jgi:S1-C subfamily serine protease